jgi:hypothetical protein
VSSPPAPIKYLSKYSLEYRGIILTIKLVHNLNLYYLDMPAYFIL